MPKIIGGAPATNFEKLSQNLDKTAESLKDAAKTALKEAGQAKDVAVAHKTDAFANVTAAGADAQFATAKLVEGLSETANAAGAATQAGGYVAAGVAGWAVEGMRDGGRYVAKGAARGLANIANNLGRILGDAQQTTVRELQGDPNAVRFSEKMFGKAAQQLQLSSDTMNLAWGSYTEAIKNLSNAAGNVSYAAHHVAGVAGNLAKAAALTTSAGAVKMAEYGVKLSNAGVQAAENGIAGARDLAVLGARYAASTANILANPDQGQVQVTVRNNLSAYQDELRQLVQASPGLNDYVKPLLAA